MEHQVTRINGYDDFWFSLLVWFRDVFKNKWMKITLDGNNIVVITVYYSTLQDWIFTNSKWIYICSDSYVLQGIVMVYGFCGHYLITFPKSMYHVCGHCHFHFYWFFSILLFSRAFSSLTNKLISNSVNRRSIQT